MQTRARALTVVVDEIQNFNVLAKYRLNMKLVRKKIFLPLLSDSGVEFVFLLL